MTLIRHGQTDWNVQRRLLGWSDVPLDRLGREQAAALGASIDISPYARVWSSDLDRAVTTARLAGWEPIADSRLREIDFGELEGLTWASLDDATRDGLVGFDGFSAPGGETMSAFVDRVTDFLESRSPEMHMLVTHGGVIRAVLRLCGEPAVFPDNATMYTVDWDRRVVLDVQTPTV
ncbi:MAG TPA: histidine phosphatase family protein [Acidimicrobiia bacterium]|nr:histidine phosphatase family protein [Acidimicrobiia bacterium]